MARCLGLVLALLGVVRAVPVSKQQQATELQAKACPKYVSLSGNSVDLKSKFKHLQVDDAYCEKICRAGFCPEDKCRCSTDPAPEDSAGAAPLVAPEAPEPLKATEDACPEYLSLAEDAPVKSSFKKMQVDNQWCEKNCRGNMLACPKDKCRCSTDSVPAAPEASQAAPIVPSVPAQRWTKKQECAKYVGLSGSVDLTKSKFKHLQVDDEYCDKNCKAGFCPEDKCKCSTDPDPEPADAPELAAVPAPGGMPVAPAVPEVAPLVAPTAIPLASPLVAPTPVAAAVVPTGDCPGEYVARNQPVGENKGAFKQVDNAYCEKNCRMGYCPDACKCSTDAETEELAAAPLVAPTAVPLAVPFASPSGDATASLDECPSFVSNNPPAPDAKGPFKQVDDAYCEKNCRAGYCPASCRCSTEPAPEPAAGDQAAAATQPSDWRKNLSKPPAPAQPTPWWKTAKTGKKTDQVSGQQGDGVPVGMPEQQLFPDNDENWKETAEIYEEGTQGYEGGAN